MCSLRRGRAPRSFRRVAARAGVTGLLLALTACASNPATTTSAQHPPLPSDILPVHTAEARTPRVEIELDGLPVQLAPRQRTPIADDPREPWSPNYGTLRPTRTTEIPASTPAPTKVAMAATERISIFQPQPIDEEDIIRRAVTEHEMRQED